MSEFADKNIRQLIHNLAKACDNIGSFELSKRIECAANENTDSGSEHLIRNTIIEIVCDHLRVNRNKLIRGRSNDNRVIGLMFCYQLLKVHLNYNNSETGKHLGGKSRESVRNGLKRFSELSDTMKHEKEILEQYHIINSRIIEYINTLEK